MIRTEGGNADNLQRLVERIEAATGPDRELDRDIGQAVSVQPAPAYTGSIDAAMSLIEAEWFWRVGHDGEGADPSLFRADVGEPVNFGFVRAVAATPALALASASLRARITQENSNGRA